MGQVHNKHNVILINMLIFSHCSVKYKENFFFFTQIHVGHMTTLRYWWVHQNDRLLVIWYNAKAFSRFQSCLDAEATLCFLFAISYLDNIGFEDVLFESDSRIFVETSRKNYENMVKLIEVYKWDTWKEKKGGWTQDVHVPR